MNNTVTTSTVTLYGAADAFGESTPAQVERIKAGIETSLAAHGLTVRWTNDSTADEANDSEHATLISRIVEEEMARA